MTNFQKIKTQTAHQKWICKPNRWPISNARFFCRLEIDTFLFCVYVFVHIIENTSSVFLRVISVFLHNNKPTEHVHRMSGRVCARCMGCDTSELWWNDETLINFPRSHKAMTFRAWETRVLCVCWHVFSATGIEAIDIDSVKWSDRNCDQMKTTRFEAKLIENLHHRRGAWCMKPKRSLLLTHRIVAVESMQQRRWKRTKSHTHKQTTKF